MAKRTKEEAEKLRLRELQAGEQGIEVIDNNKWMEIKDARLDIARLILKDEFSGMAKILPLKQDDAQLCGGSVPTPEGTDLCTYDVALLFQENYGFTVQNVVDAKTRLLRHGLDLGYICLQRKKGVLDFNIQDTIYCVAWETVPKW